MSVEISGQLTERASGYPLKNIQEHVEDQTGQPTMVWLYPQPIGSEDWVTNDEALQVVFGPGVNSGNRAEVMLDLLHRMVPSDHQRIRFVKDVWSATDNIYDLRGSLAFRLSGLAAEGDDFRDFLDVDEREWFDGLGPSFTVYRGCSEGRLDGVSWTTNREVALEFADGHRGSKIHNPVLVSATCSADDVLLAVNDRDEYEIVVDPADLTDVWVHRLPSN